MGNQRDPFGNKVVLGVFEHRDHQVDQVLIAMCYVACSVAVKQEARCTAAGSS